MNESEEKRGKNYINARKNDNENVLFENLKTNIRKCHSIRYIGPLSVDPFVEGEDEADVDVEQCSDSEAQSRSRTPRAPSNSSRATPQSDEERLTPEPVRKKVNFLKLTKTIIFIEKFSLFSSAWQF